MDLFWHYSISHSARMINVCPDKLSCILKTPHELFYGVKPESRLWFTIFTVRYFQNKMKVAVSRSDTQSQTLAEIDIGQARNLNVIQFYNPVTRSTFTEGE